MFNRLFSAVPDHKFQPSRDKLMKILKTKIKWPFSWFHTKTISCYWNFINYARFLKFEFFRSDSVNQFRFERENYFISYHANIISSSCCLAPPCTDKERKENPIYIMLYISIICVIKKDCFVNNFHT